jgi:hypothetical protein
MKRPHPTVAQKRRVFPTLHDSGSWISAHGRATARLSIRMETLSPMRPPAVVLPNSLRLMSPCSENPAARRLVTISSIRRGFRVPANTGIYVKLVSKPENVERPDLGLENMRPHCGVCPDD